VAVAPAEVSLPLTLCIDRAGLARMLGVSVRQLYRLDDAGKLPAALALGTCRRWSIEEIESWVRAGAPPRRVWQNLRSVASAPREREAGLH
jgi:predicted DNA-binding transcriptional regulator AlpA